MNFPAFISKKVLIDEIESATSDTWDEIWQSCDYATYFHSREWAEIWQNYSQKGIRLKPKLITFSDGKKALLPLTLEHRYKGLMNLYSSCVEGGFGGWISRDSLQLEHAVLLTQYLTEELGNLLWRLNPYEDLTWKTGVVWEYPEDTHAIHLKADFKTLFTNQSSTVRKARKAQKAGVSITTASTIADWKEYYQVYQASLQRWGEKATSQYRWDLFEDLFRRNSPNIRLWIARYEGQIVSGAICLYSQCNIMYWHGSSREEYFQLRPVNLLMYTIMKEAYEQGYSWFDFGTSAGLESVAAFKRSFGASPLPCHVVCTSTPFKRLVEKIEYRLKAS